MFRRRKHEGGLHAGSKARTLSTVLGLALGAAACGGDSGISGPIDRPGVDGPGPQPGSTGSSYDIAQFTPEGDVRETSDGFSVDGSLHLDTGEGVVTFANADLAVTKDSRGRVTNITGHAEIPSPHERIGFENPIEADVGLFSGRWLNQNRDLGILLRDDTDYFVFRVKAAFQMNIATGETGADATKPISIKAPLGGEILLVMDYTDPMYYVHGSQDLLGDAGLGWSLHGRIPFEPRFPVNGLGSFQGNNIRTGTFPIFKVLSVQGQLVDNQINEVHLSAEDPLSSDLRVGYQAGFNGAMDLDLSVSRKAGRKSGKPDSGTEILSFGFSIPLAEGSGGVFSEASVQQGFDGHAYVRAKTSDDRSWWPTFLPIRPANDLEVSGFLQSNGDFAIDMAGQYGLDGVTGPVTMNGAFHVGNDVASLTGGVTVGEDRLQLTGEVSDISTTVSIAPPQSILDGIADEVNERLASTIADARAAWDSVQQATGDYQFELSLRGLRSSLPTIADNAKAALQTGIANELARHTGTAYYSSLRSGLNAAVAPYYRELDNLKAQAQQVTDNDATRAAIEAALRKVAFMKTFTYTYRYKVFGVTVKTVTVTRTVLSDSQVARILQAADDVQYIKWASDRKLRLEQIYSQVDGRAIFENIKDEIEDGVIQIREVGDFGYRLLHADRSVEVFASVAGTEYALNAVDVFDVPAMIVELTDLMIRSMARG